MEEEEGGGGEGARQSQQKDEEEQNGSSNREAGADFYNLWRDIDADRVAVWPCGRVAGRDMAGTCHMACHLPMPLTFWQFLIKQTTINAFKLSADF